MLERRVLNSYHMRAEQAGNAMRVSGYAARYGVLSNMLGDKRTGLAFRERISKRAFDDVVASPQLDCLALQNHDMDKVLGRTRSRASTPHTGARRSLMNRCAARTNVPRLNGSGTVAA
jgi:phage head maturation protease